jgi:glycerol-3-phosphate O-acyltransferase
MNNYHQGLQSVVEPTTSLLESTFNHLYINGPEIPNEVCHSPTMIVSSHRSHADYFILGEKFHRLGINNLRFAAGDNLTKFPIIGKKFLSYGAFAVERNRTSGKNYVRTLCDQVVGMVEKGDNIIVFPESGRSYYGSMLEARGVILSAHIIAQYRHPETKHFMIPVTISYEQLPELLYFKMLQRGKRLRKESRNIFSKAYGDLLYFGSDLLAFGKFMNASKFGVHYGDVYIDYGHPFVVQDVVDLKANYKTAARDELSGHRESVQQICNHLFKQMVSLYRVLPMHLVASILKQTGSPVSSARAAELAGPLSEKLQQSGRNCRSIIELPATQIIEKGIQQLIVMKSITIKNQAITVTNASVIDYYAATADQSVAGGM